MIGILPSYAIMDATISKGHFYDTTSTIMKEVEPDKSMPSEEFWTRNVFRFNKYRPVYMLSNKDIFNLIPQENVSTTQRVSAPAVYYVSLKKLMNK